MGLLDKLKKKKQEPEVNPKSEIPKLVQEKKYDAALEILDQHQDQDSETDWYTKGEILTKLDRKQEALDSYLKAVKLNETYLLAWLKAGQRYFELGDFRKASDAFDKTLNLEQNAREAKWDNLATFYYMMSLYMDYLDNHDKKIREKISEHIRKLQKVLGLSDSEEKFLTFCSENFQNIVTKLEPKSEPEKFQSEQNQQN